jgi:hypothetical protein
LISQGALKATPNEEPAMPGTSFESESDPQDQAESFDESNLVAGEGDDMRTFEESPDLLDVTQAAGDRDEDEALALDADEFSEDAIDDTDFEEDDELHYRAATEEHEDELDGLGPEDGYNEDALGPDEIEGLDAEVRDAGAVSGGEDDFTNFQSRTVSDEDLQDMGYAENRGGEIRAKPEAE